MAGFYVVFRLAANAASSAMIAMSRRLSTRHRQAAKRRSQNPIVCRHTAKRSPERYRAGARTAPSAHGR